MEVYCIRGQRLLPFADGQEWPNDIWGQVWPTFLTLILELMKNQGKTFHPGN